MEEARCWMWTKQNNHGWSSNSQTSTTAKPSCEDDSWEEQAFAEDAAGGFGGCIWPPRSYSCCFCRREFRSAQALGGHMNVHRRDRARLKQSTNPYNELLHQNHVQYPCTSSALQYPSFASVYNPKPNSDFNSRVLAPPAKENSSENSLVVPSSSMVQGHHRSPFSSPKSWSNFVSSRYSRESDSKKEEDKNTRIIESGIPDLSVNLNLLVCRKRLTMSDDEDESFSCGKRKRTTDASPLPFFLKSSSPEVLELSTSSIEEIDLELRLGDRPKVK